MKIHRVFCQFCKFAASYYYDVGRPTHTTWVAPVLIIWFLDEANPMRPLPFEPCFLALVAKATASSLHLATTS